MLKTIGIWLVLFSLAVCYGKNGTENYKLVYPDNIPVNTSFNISLITSSVFPSADRLVLYIIPGEKISLQKIELKSLYANEVLNFSSSKLEGYIGQVYKTVINLEDSTLSAGMYFQILLSLSSESASKSDIKLYGVFKLGNQILGLLKSGGNDRLDDNFITANLEFYKPQKSAGKSLLFENGSSLNFSLQKINSENLLTEFWINLDNPDITFLQVFAKNYSDFQYTFSTNNYQMFILKAVNKNLSNINPYFASNNVWYHIAIDFSFTNHTITFYCNGNLISMDDIPVFLKANDLELYFSR